MNPTEVISTLKDRGVTLWQEGGKLKYRAPKGAVTEQEREALKAHKASILDALVFYHCRQRRRVYRGIFGSYRAIADLYRAARP